jgi:PAS domain S-box-containing protein
MPFRFSTILAKFGFFRTFMILFGAWTLVMAGVLGVIKYYSAREDRAIALNRAVDSYHKDLAYRRWSAERGGVYVPLDEKTPPNPYLAHMPNRDIITDQGTRLTLVNPAYMTRMVHELGEEKYGLMGHITSLHPIRPENAPDAWERKALEAFEHGAREHSEVLEDKGRTVLRFMGAFLVDASCLPCHAQQGYKEGDVRGGISVTVPVGSGAQALGFSHLGISIIILLAFWALGSAGILFWARRLVSLAEEQRRMLSNLEYSFHRFRQLFQSSPAPMIIHRSGRLTEVNLAAVRLLDAEDPSQLIGQDILHFIHPDFRDLVAQRIQAVEQTRKPAPIVEEVFITLHGREVPVEVQKISLDLPDGPAILAFAQDLTERRQSQEQRRKLEAEIQQAQKLESLGSLAGGIAHDMNNVLAAILGMASLLQFKHEGDAPLAKSLRIIEDAASRGRDLVKGLTDFARKGLQQAQVIDLNALLQRELDLLMRTTRQRYTFNVQLDADLPSISGEPSTLGSAFMNLCVNAFDAMPRGGTLSIRTRLEGNQVCLMVADTGEGIPAKILPLVTDPFFTTKPLGRGTGLGLAMVYGTVKAHGGTLDIQSEVGKGTSIFLRFPALVAEPATSVIDGGSTTEGMEHPMRILLVDDDELIQSVMPPMLEQLGHHVETASGGLEATRRLGAGLDIDLVILDYNMPGLSGADVLPRILQLRPTVRVLIATGFQDTELKILLAEFPSVQTLQKPFSLAELRQALRGG